MPKRGDFVRKNSEFFGIRGGVSANPKFLLTEKIWSSKLIGGGGGVSLVWIFSEKNQFFLNDASPYYLQFLATFGKFMATFTNVGKLFQHVANVVNL